MKTQMDIEAAQRCAVALTAMINARFEPREPNARPAMFSFAPVGGEDGFEQASIDEGMDIVVLAFEPGREHEGPTNVAIYEKRNGKLSTWPKCAPWAWSKEGPCFLLAEGTTTGFAYDGTSLVAVEDVPVELVAERSEMGAELLRLMTLVAPDVTHRRRIR